jgi:peptidoglycan hydrolase CwlO-like protein
MSECNCHRFITRDEFESRMGHIMGLFDRFFWPREAISNIQADVAWLRNQAGVNQAQLMKEFDKMAANFDELNADLQVLVAGYQALQAENAVLKAQLATADADKQAAVAAALAADDAVDQAAVDAADAVVEAALNPPPAG